MYKLFVLLTRIPLIMASLVIYQGKADDFDLHRSTNEL